MANVLIRRGATINDLSGMLRAEHEAWPEEQAFTEEHFRSHLEVFPEGIFLAEVDGETAGVGISEILDYDLKNPIQSWYEVSDDGFIHNTHNPDGDSLYGVSLSVSPRFAGMDLGSKMLDVAKEAIKNKGLKQFVIGSRIPRYFKHCDIPVEEYIHAKKRNRYLDPEIEFYTKNGFEIVCALKDYFEDASSLNYGVLMVWRNI